MRRCWSGRGRKSGRAGARPALRTRTTRGPRSCSIRTSSRPFTTPSLVAVRLPLEAQRLGLEAYASDLNPVAVLINKAMIEIPPKFAGKPPVNPESRKDKDLFKKTWRGCARVG